MVFDLFIEDDMIPIIKAKRGREKGLQIFDGLSVSPEKGLS